MTARQPTHPPAFKPSTECPKCGVPITPGYVRCPKCRAKMPSRAPSSVTAGGLALPESESGGFLWGLLAIVALVGGLTLATWPRAKSLLGMMPDANPAAVDEATEEDADEPAAAASPPAEKPRPDGAAELRDALAQAELYSKIRDRGTVLEIESSECESNELKAIINRQTTVLKESGYTAVRCVALHGEEMFKRPL